VRNIFCDMDGVLADLRWAQYAAHLDLPTRFAGMFPDVDVRDPAFEDWLHTPHLWESGPICTTEFWTGIPMYSWAPGLLAALRSQGHVRICSNPGLAVFTHHAAHGKVVWCQHNLRIKNRDIILMADKHLLAKSKDDVLIDDDEVNVASWIYAGGTGILFPQMWNINRIYVPTDLVSWVMEKLS